MTVEKVDAIPIRAKYGTCTTINNTKKTSSRGYKVKSTFSAMRRRINAIMDIGCKYGKINFTSDEYATAHIARNSLQSHAITNDIPIKFTTRSEDLYFIRLDM